MLLARLYQRIYTIISTNGHHGKSNQSVGCIFGARHIILQWKFNEARIFTPNFKGKFATLVKEVTLKSFDEAGNVYLSNKYFTILQFGKT